MAGPTTPKVSVCIPAFNAADYLRQAVESVLEQGFRNFEIIIVDNCSTDGTEALVDALRETSNGLIRYYKNDSNIGMFGNFNRCLEYAKGEYIKFLCADDLLLAGCLEKMNAALDEHQSVKLVSSSRMLIDERGQEIGVRRYKNSDAVVRGTHAIKRCLFGRNYIGEPSAVMFRKADLKNDFREDLPQLSDMDLWFQLLEQGDFFSMGAPLCAIRIHPAQLTHTNIGSGALIEDTIKIFEAYSQKPYMRVTWLLKSKHRLLMTYRIWLSRRSISDERREMVLDRYASKSAYKLMPLLDLALRLKERIVGAH